MTKHSPRAIYSALYSEGRKALRDRPALPACMAIYDAEMVLIHDEGYPIEQTLAMSRAAIFAIHWSRKQPQPDVPRNRSEIHRCFSMSAEESRVWFSSPAEFLP